MMSNEQAAIPYKVQANMPQHLPLQLRQLKARQDKRISSCSTQKQKEKTVTTLVKREKQLVHSNSETKQSNANSSSDGHGYGDQEWTKRQEIQSQDGLRSLVSPNLCTPHKIETTVRTGRACDDTILYRRWAL